MIIGSNSSSKIGGGKEGPAKHEAVARPSLYYREQTKISSQSDEATTSFIEKNQLTRQKTMITPYRQSLEQGHNNEAQNQASYSKPTAASKAHKNLEGITRTPTLFIREKTMLREKTMVREKTTLRQSLSEGQKVRRSSDSGVDSKPPTEPSTPLPPESSRPSSSMSLASVNELEPELDDESRQFSGDYWSQWDAQPAETMPFKAPSSIQAILMVPTISINADGASNNGEIETLPTIILACSKGEIFGFSPLSNWTKVEWTSEVKTPHDLPAPIFLFGVEHAIYDSVSDGIYVSIQEPFILQLSRRHLVESSMSGGSIEFMSQFINAKSPVFGISVDPKRRLLFACERKTDAISIWQINSPEQNAKNPLSSACLAATINCIPQPLSIATFFDKNRRKSVVKIAIHAGDHDIYLLQGSLPQFKKQVLANRNQSADGQVSSIDNLFLVAVPDYDHLLMATKHKGDALSLGSVNYPEALVFDSRGNLFVADNWNNRFQIFTDSAETSLPNGRVRMKAVWASERCTNNALRIALIGKHPQTGKPGVLVTKRDLLEWYYSKK